MVATISRSYKPLHVDQKSPVRVYVWIVRLTFLLLAASSLTSHAADVMDAASSPPPVAAPGTPPWGALGDFGLASALVSSSVIAGRALEKLLSFFTRLTTDGIVVRLHPEDRELLEDTLTKRRRTT